MIIMIGYVEPLIDKVQNKMELFNECCVLLHLYHSLCFTDFQPDLNWRDTTGFSLIATTGFGIFVNLAVVTIISLAVMSRKAKLTYLQTKQRMAINKRKRIERTEIERR